VSCGYEPTLKPDSQTVLTRHPATLRCRAGNGPTANPLAVGSFYMRWTLQRADALIASGLGVELMNYRREDSRQWSIVLLLWAILMSGVGLYVFMGLLLYDP
jgi:hypothetical protein